MPEPCRLLSTPRTELPTVRVAAIADRQEGVVGRAQLRELGISDRCVARWISQGYLHRRHRGVYTVGHRLLSVRGRLIAALLYVRTGVLSHTTAAWWWGIIDTDPRRIHISTTSKCRSTSEIKVHRRRALESVVLRGLPVTPVAATLVDLAAILPRDQLRRALAETEFRRLVDVRDIEAALGRGRRGSAALRRALDAHLPELAHARSVLEERFVLLCEGYDIPMPELNVPICGFVVDALWRDDGLVVELDGKAAHGTGSRIESDRRRDLVLRSNGLRVLRYTWAQLTETPALVAADVKLALGRRAQEAARRV